MHVEFDENDVGLILMGILIGGITYAGYKMLKIAESDSRLTDVVSRDSNCASDHCTKKETTSLKGDLIEPDK